MMTRFEYSNRGFSINHAGSLTPFGNLPTRVQTADVKWHSGYFMSTHQNLLEHKPKTSFIHVPLTKKVSSRMRAAQVLYKLVLDLVSQHLHLVYQSGQCHHRGCRSYRSTYQVSCSVRLCEQNGRSRAPIL